MRRMHFTVVAAAVLLMVTGGSATISQPARAAAVYASLPSCTWSNLNANVLWGPTHIGVPGGGAVTGRIAYTQHGNRSCVLRGWVKARILNRDGKPLAVTERQIPTTGPVKSLRVWKTTPGKPIRLVSTKLTWLNWCKGKVKGPDTLRVTLPNNGGTKVLPIGQLGGSGVMTPSCVNPTAGSLLDVGRFKNGS